MAALDFPNSPTLNQQYTHPTTGIIWVWDGAKWVSGTSATAYAPIASPVFTGNPQAPNPPAGDADTSVATTSFVAAAVAPYAGNVGRNLIHNSMFNVAQRGVGPFTGIGYALDRWFWGGATDTGTVTRGDLTDTDRSQIGDEAASAAWQHAFAGNAAAGAHTNVIQRIEGVRRLAGKTVVISFYAKCASGTLKVGINVFQGFGSGGSPSAPGFALATGNSVTIGTTWARYVTTVAVPSITGKTLGNNSDDTTQVLFYFSSGSNTNATAGNIGVQSGTINLWGVQLEIGSVATPLEKPDPQVDLANCQRFYQTGYFSLGVGGVAGVNNSGSANFITQMRASPTMIIIGSPSYTNASGGGIAYNNATHYTAYAMVGVTGYANFTLTWTASADL